MGTGNIFLRHRQACQKLRKTSPVPTGLVRCIGALHRSVMAPAGLVIFFLRHRQACQKLRKNITSPVGLLRAFKKVSSNGGKGAQENAKPKEGGGGDDFRQR